jgi:hypothetical protein
VQVLFRKHLGCGGEDPLSDDEKEPLPVGDPEARGDNDPQDADDETSSRENQ